MLTVQGEGRGHITQAIAVKEMLQRHGHSVCAVLAGGNLEKPTPPYFQEAFDIPVQRIASPGFAQKKNRGISLRATFVQALKTAPELRSSLDAIKTTIAQTHPDLIINFLEPMMGLYNLRARVRPSIPVLSVGHQFMQAHPAYIKIPKSSQQLAMREYIRMTGARSHHLALSFHPAENSPNRTVCPPILRKQLFQLTPTQGDYLLVYLVAAGYAEDIIRWNKANPKIPIHCFCDRPNAPEQEHITKSLTFHRLHGEKFLKMMAACRAIVCTAGFEAISEAAYLGKPALVVPVENHLEQQLNAAEVEKYGLGIKDTHFNLTRLLQCKPTEALTHFKGWVDKAERISLQTIEAQLTKSTLR